MIRLLFVTVAFGIGIDVQNIGRVIHIGVPHTMEEFFQEAGRCGRYGLPASSTVYYNNHDISSSRKVCQEMIDYVLSDEITFYRILDILYQNQICQLICVAMFMQRHVIVIKAATSEMLENVSCADDQEKEIPSKSTAFDLQLLLN
jgi:superfamily II DNA helicase RecQ